VVAAGASSLSVKRSSIRETGRGSRQSVLSVEGNDVGGSMGSNTGGRVMTCARGAASSEARSRTAREVVV